MRRTFLTALLLAAFAAVVFAPSAMTKKEPPTPPPTPTGMFTVGLRSGLALTGMTLASDDHVAVSLCWMTYDQSLFDCHLLGDNTGSLGQEIALPDWTFANTHTQPVMAAVRLDDVTEDVGYWSFGMLDPPGPGDNYMATHATLGWTADATQMLLSMNDGSEFPLTASAPTLGEGNFDATLTLIEPEPTGIRITGITGYSDGPTADEQNCSFHAEFTYTVDGKMKTEKLTAVTGLLAAEAWGSEVAAPLGEGLVNPGAILTQTEPGDYVLSQFGARIESKDGTLLAELYTPTFWLHKAGDYVNGCPVPGVLAYDFG